MAAEIGDLFSESTTNDRPNAAALTGIKASGAATLTVDSTTGWATATAVHFTMYEVDANGAIIASTQRDYKGIVNSSTTINNLVVRGGTDREFPIGAKVIAAPTAAWADDLVTGIVAHADQDGTLKADSVTTAKIADANVTTAKIADGAVTNAKLSTTAGELGGAWVAFTPSFTNFTIGNGTIEYSKYTRVGETIKIRVAVTLGSTSSMGSTPYMTLPVTAHADYAGVAATQSVGTGAINDTGTAAYELALYLASSATNLLFRYLGDSSNKSRFLGITSSAPMTWADGDGFQFQIEYEAA